MGFSNKNVELGAAELPKPPPLEPLKCPRCNSGNTKFCYYNNYKKSQPRHFCKSCKRHWTKGGTLRNVPVGGGAGRKKKRPRPTPAPPQQDESVKTANSEEFQFSTLSTFDLDVSWYPNALDHYLPNLESSGPWPGLDFSSYWDWGDVDVTWDDDHADVKTQKRVQD